jgi:hypothetical protein
VKPAAIVAAVAIASACCTPASAAPPTFADPVPVTIRGYSGDAMEPEISRDGRYLFFNNSNTAPDTNLYYAGRIDDLTFQYRGPVAGANSSSVDAVASIASNGHFYVASTRSYAQTASIIYEGWFANGKVSGVRLVDGLSRRQPPLANFDVAISADDQTIYFVDSVFAPIGGIPLTADLVVASRRGGGFERRRDSSTILATVNMPVALQYAAYISRDGRELFFTRVIPSQDPAIFVATRPETSSAFGVPAKLDALTGFVEGPTLSPDGRGLYYHKKVGNSWRIFRASRR